MEKFSSRGLITNETNLHAIGMSNGGVFAYTLVQAGGLGFSSGLSTCAHGDINIDPSLPFMWQMCENDSQESVARKKGNSVANYEKLLKKDIPSIHVTHQLRQCIQNVLLEFVEYQPQHQEIYIHVHAR